MTVVSWQHRASIVRVFDGLSSAISGSSRAARAAAALSLVGGIVHGLAVPAHRGWTMAAAFFALVALAQLALGVELIRRPAPAVLRAGAFGSAALLLVYGTSRTIGLPVGPHPWTPEDIGALDLIAAVAGSGVILLLSWLAGGAPDERVRFGAGRACAAWLAISGLTATIAMATPVDVHGHGVAIEASHGADLAPLHRLGQHLTPSRHDDRRHGSVLGSDECVFRGSPVLLPAEDDATRASALAYVDHGSEHGSVVVYDVAADTVSTVLELDAHCWVGQVALRDRRTLTFTHDRAVYELDLPTGEVKTHDVGLDPGATSWSPDGSTLAFVSFEPRSPKLSLSLFDVRTGDIRRLRLFPTDVWGRCGWQGDETRIEWSRDGTRLLVTNTAFDDPDGTIFVMDLTGRDLTRPRYGTFARWLADSSSVVYQSLQGDLERRWRIVDVLTGEEEVLAIEGWRFRPALSPDGSLLAYDDGGYPDQEAPTTMVFDLATRRERPVADGFAGPIWLDGRSLAVTVTRACGDPCHDGRWEHAGAVDRVELATDAVERLKATRTMWVDTLYGRASGSTEGGVTVGSPPVFRARPDVTTSTLREITFDVEAMDDDGTPPRYVARGVPEGATFDPESRTFVWRPMPGQEGRWAVRFVATDRDGLVARQTIIVTVRPVVALPAA